MTIDQFYIKLKKYHLLQHPFYQDWQAGRLTIKNLQDYGCQYYQHIKNFPRHISAIHSKCSSFSNRQILLSNLCDEEAGEDNHPELWLRFTDALKLDRNIIQKTPCHIQTIHLINTYRSLTNSTYAEGLGALFAQEYQVPAIAETKLIGLKKFYNIDTVKGTQYFVVHTTTDKRHTKECWNLIEQLSYEDQKEAIIAAEKIAYALWKFLDGVQTHRRCA